jgi:hypothetical protein
VNFVVKAFTRMLTTRDTWEDIIEDKSTSVRPVGRNFLRNSILYVVGKFVILRGTRIGYPVILVGKVFCQKANS